MYIYIKYVIIPHLNTPWFDNLHFHLSLAVASMAAQKENIVLFPFMSQSHIIPFLALALKLEQEKGYQVTIVNTLVIKKLHSYLPKDSSIRLLEIPYNSAEHGIPPDIQSIDSLPEPLKVRFLISTVHLRPAFTEIITSLVEEQNGIRPLCIISDMFFGWTAEVAHKFGIFHAIFYVSGGYGMAVHHTMWLNHPHLKTKCHEFSLPGFPEGYNLQFDQLPSVFQLATRSPFMDTLLQQWLETDAMLFNTVEEIDGTGLTYFRQQFSCPIWPIGPSSSSVGSRAHGGNESETTSKICMEWLDSKPLNSVLYVGFGSQWTPSVLQTKQLAEALEDSGVNFIWVARPPSNFITNSISGDADWMPDGFLERVQKSNKGLVVLQWVFQAEIMSHSSIGAFLNHCGWNSVLEALSNCVPMLSWPMHYADNPYNAKMLEEELGVCVRIGNGRECEIHHEEIVKKIKLVMEENKGMVMRMKACNLNKMLKNACKDNEWFKGSSAKALDEFLDAALETRKFSKSSE